MGGGPLSLPAGGQGEAADLISTLPARVGQQNADIRLSGQFIQEQHCVFRSATSERGEGEAQDGRSSSLRCGCQRQLG